MKNNLILFLLALAALTLPARAAELPGELEEALPESAGELEEALPESAGELLEDVDAGSAGYHHSRHRYYQ